MTSTLHQKSPSWPEDSDRIKDTLAHILFRERRLSLEEASTLVGWGSSSLRHCLHGNRDFPAKRLVDFYTGLGNDVRIYQPVIPGDLILCRPPQDRQLDRGPFLILASIMGRLERIAQLEQKERTTQLSADEEYELERLLQENISDLQAILARRRQKAAQTNTQKIPQ